MALFNDACRIAVRSAKTAAGAQHFVTDSVLNEIVANPPPRLRFTSEPEFLGFIKTVAYRRTIDRLRRQTRRGANIDPASTEVPDPRQHSIELNLTELNELFDGLDSLERNVVNLRMQQDLTFARIAAALGIHERKAERLYASALAKLGKVFDES